MPRKQRDKRERRQKRSPNNKHVTDHVPRREVKPLFPMSDRQSDYMHAIDTRDIIFGIGPAGTGKTYIAAAMAADALIAGEIDSIVITRPMVGVGEDMGFLPGEEDEKYAPWIEPIIDVLEERMGKSQVRMFLKNGRIQAKPLMFMRGKTHKGTWVLLDEAQNTTPTQMKMFLTRIGEGSKLIVDGDVDQTDIRGICGLRDAVERLERLPDVGVVTFTSGDIVRHGLIQKIVECYESRSG